MRNNKLILKQYCIHSLRAMIEKYNYSKYSETPHIVRLGYRSHCHIGVADMKE